MINAEIYVSKIYVYDIYDDYIVTKVLRCPLLYKIKNLINALKISFKRMLQSVTVLELNY